MAQAKKTYASVAERSAAWRQLYDQGCNDRDLARREGYSIVTIRTWRHGLSLPPIAMPGKNGRPSDAATLTPELKRRCISLLERGIGAIQVHRETGVAFSTLCKWRTDMLRVNPQLRRPACTSKPTRRKADGSMFSKLRPDRRAAAFLLYADKLDDHAIARALGIGHQQVWKWRQALYLPAVRGRGGLRRETAPKPVRRPPAPSISPLSNPLHAKIVSAIGRALAPDLTDDAASEMWLAVLEGRLAVDQVEAQARRYRGQVMSAYASRFGPTSLDEDLTGDGFRLLDMLRDERSSDWLEENGATVW